MEILRSPDGSITFQTMVSVTVPAGTTMLEAENLLMDKVNEAGTTLTGRHDHFPHHLHPSLHPSHHLRRTLFHPGTLFHPAWHFVSSAPRAFHPAGSLWLSVSRVATGAWLRDE